MTDLSNLTENQKLRFTTEVVSLQKKNSTAILWLLLLGGMGAHKFYLGKNSLGIAYLVFSWTCIPLIISLFDLFTIKEQVQKYNDRVEQEIVTKIKAMG